MASRSRGAPLLLIVGAVVGLLLAGFLVLGALGGFLKFGQTEQIDRSTPPLLVSLKDLSNYRAASGQFQVVVDVEEDVENVPSFLAGQRTLMVAGGTVDAEVDFSGLDDNAVRISEDRLSATIYLPHAELTEARIDNELTYIAAQERGLLDRLDDALGDAPVRDTQELYVLAEDKLEATAAQTDLTDRAEANTDAMLRGLLGGLGYTDVEIIFSDGAPRDVAPSTEGG